MEGQEYNANAAKAYALAIRFIGIRPRSRFEVRNYLVRKGFEGEITEPIIERLGSVGLLSDLSFAESWVASRQAVRPRSRRVLEQELMAKGVAHEDIVVVLREYDAEAELESLVEVARRKQRLSQYQNAEKLQGYLVRQGYTITLIKKALARLSDES